MCRTFFLFAVVLTLLQNGLGLRTNESSSQKETEKRRGLGASVLEPLGNTSIRQTGRPNHWDSLGFGIQPFDSFFDHKKLRARVLDLGSLPSTANVRDKVSVRFINLFNYQTSTEAGFNTFTERISRDQSTTVSTASFSTTISSHFGFDVTQNEDYFFSRTTGLSEIAHIQITQPTISNLRSMVIPEVAQFLANHSPAEIFDTYGTHVTTGLVVGGELELWSYASAAEFSSKSQFTTAVNASFNESVSGRSSLTEEEERLFRLANSTEGLIVRGGRFTKGPGAKERWIDSTSENAQEIRYLPNGVIPIWRLIPSQAQENRVKAWYDKVFGPQAVFLKRFSSPDLSTLEKERNPSAEVYVPDGWKVVSGGATIEYFGAGQLLRQSHPVFEDGKPVGWFAESSDHIQEDPGRVQAHVVAIWDPFDACDVITRQKLSGYAQHPETSVTLPPGYAIVGGGARVLSSEPKSFLVQNYPESDRDWLVSAKDHLVAHESRIEAYVIGLRFWNGKVPRTQMYEEEFGPEQHPNGEVHVDDDFAIIGGGARVSRGGLGNMLVDVEPSDDGSAFFGYAKDHLRPDRENITVSVLEVFGGVFVDHVDDVLLIDPTRE